jgi:hypothetical protein
MRGTGGLRKIRFVGPGAGRGKSGTYRVCYAYFPKYGTVVLAVVFGKAEKDNLTGADLHVIADVIRAYEAEFGHEFDWRGKPRFGQRPGGTHE